MLKDILVAIIEDDLFSRNWMALLLVRDWRTRVIAEVTDRQELTNFLANDQSRIDILLVDVDFFGQVFNFTEIYQEMAKHQKQYKVLCTGVKADKHILKQLNTETCCGYILKHEIGYSLGWALSFAAEGNWLFTPGTFDLANKMNFNVPVNKMILKGRSHFPGFSDHETEVARLAIIFSLGRRDLADELKISDQWSYGLVSELYTKLGLGEILSGEVDPLLYLGNNPVLQFHFREIVDQLGTSKKARDLETLAFHLLTLPNIEN